MTAMECLQTRPSKTSILSDIREYIEIEPTVSEDINLIEQGLDSLQLMRLVDKWRRAGSDVTFADLIECPILSVWLTRLLSSHSDNGNQSSPLLTSTSNGTEKREHDDQPFDLTDVQYAYWLGRQNHQTLGGVSCHAYIEIDGNDVESRSLERAWHRLLCHHPMLRAVFTPDGKQRIGSDIALPALLVRDYQNLTLKEAELALLETREHLSHRKLAIDEAHVADISLSLLPDNKTRIHFDVDLLVADVQSIHILLKDLADLYGEFKRGNDKYFPPADPDWQFKHYLEAKKQADQGRTVADEAYWKKRLATLPAGPQLPLSCLPESVSEPRFIRRTYTLSHDKWTAIKGKATSKGLTPAVMLATAYAEVLAHWSSQARFVLNVPIFDRHGGQPGIENVIADFTNLLLLECDCTQPLPFTARVKATQKQLHKDLSHSTYSAVSIQRELQKQGLSEGVSAPVVFACNLGTQLITQTCRETLGSLNYMISQTPQVWLDHQLYEMEDGLLLAWDSVDELFPEGVIDSAFNAYCQLLESLVDDVNWDRPYNPSLQKEQRVSRVSANSTERSVTRHVLHHAFFEWASKAPERTALIAEQTTLSYGELAYRARQLAALLIKQGLKPEEPVAVTLPRGVDQACAVLGILAAGGCYVPIGTHQPLARQQRIHATAGIRFTLTDT
ncbi:condensation domain-containing protein, partial [Enterovibrio norvegicus]